MMITATQKKTNRKRRGRGEGSIYQRADGLWTSSVSMGIKSNGKRKRRTVYGKTKEEVRKKLGDLVRRSDVGELAATSKTTAADFVDSWIQGAEKNHAPATIDRYKLTAVKIREHLGRMPISGLQPIHVQQMLLDMGRAGESRDSQLKAGRLLSVVCKAAIERKLLQANPVSNLPKPERKEVVTFQIDQLRTLLDAAVGHRVFRAYIPLAIDSGCRLRELLALEW